jgi:hypothetical protein
MNRTIITLAAIATLALTAIAGATAAAAATTTDYRQALTDAGYSVGAQTKSPHATLHSEGTSLIATKGGQSVTLEVIEYPSRAKLKEDFTAVNGSGPAPAVATNDFDGRVLYWSENMILAVSFRAPNEPGLARAAADIFLGRRGTGGPDAGTGTSTSGGTSTGTSGGTRLPATGSGGYLRRDATAGDGSGLSRTVIAAAIAGTIIACTGLAVAARRRA